MKPTRTELGYSNRWARSAKAFLKRNPWCAYCLKLGRYTPATEVDHIQPRRTHPELFWKASNWQALCKSCHSVKTGQERTGKVRGCDVDGNPLHPGEHWQ